MTIIAKIKWIILPALFLIGFGILEIKFPHAMDGFDDGYTGRGMAGFIVLLFELFLLLTWGKIGGAIAILFGIITILVCLLLKNEPTKSIESKDERNFTSNKLASLALRAGKNYVQRKSQNQQP